MSAIYTEKLSVMKLNLEKAIEKAKAKRVSVRPAQNPAKVEQFSKQWVAPHYTQIRHAAVDPAILEQNHCVNNSGEIIEAAFYEVLRAQIQIEATKRELRTFMVTSAQPGEGKTLTSINLALSCAKAYNQTVLLVDADLKKQQVHRYLGIESPCGLVDHLVDGRSIRECMVWPGIEKMVLISGGKLRRDSAELLAAPMMNSFLTEVRDRYADRMVIVDVPPVLMGADAITLARMVDGIVLVAQAGRTARKDLKKAVGLLPKEKILGVVLNRHRLPLRNYYNYYYRRGQAPEGK